MARRSANAIEAAQVQTEEAQVQTEAAQVQTEAAQPDPWREMRTVTLPRHGKNEQNFCFVAVNGRTFQVPRSGDPVQVPLPVYEALTNSDELRRYAADRKDAMETV